jgi:hypothetical protein
LKGGVKRALLDIRRLDMTKKQIETKLAQIQQTLTTIAYLIPETRNPFSRDDLVDEAGRLYNEQRELAAAYRKAA